MAQNNTAELDIREIAPWERYPRILAAFDELPTGGTLKVLYNHSLRPIYYLMRLKREGKYELATDEHNPKETVARIKKLKK